MTRASTLDPLAPWHKVSFDRFMDERLPRLLEDRLPLVGYQVTPTGTYTCSVKVALACDAGQAEVEYANVPRPDDEGVFEVDGVRRVVVPTASREELDLAEIRCVGERLYDAIDAGLGEAPSGLPWDASLVRAWLPLDAWVRDFLTESRPLDADIRAFAAVTHDPELLQIQRPAAGQPLDERNWLARAAHLRRILIPDRKSLYAPGQLGRTCPFETPEGTNIGRVLSVAIGAEIRDGKLVVVDEVPEAALGLTASMVPLLEHDDPNRLLMGVNMMRQWLTPVAQEPALVQTGNEPDVPGFWCGRNLLTAFVSWGIDTFEDALVISESCAKRLDDPEPVEPGDKLSNRHGQKGTVSRILPDDEMPHLPDGTPVDLCVDLLGCHTRLNFGQIREAVLGRIAQAEGEPVVVPPFHAPGEQALRRRLTEAGLPESGMETLCSGKKGSKLSRPSTVGWVYWGKTYHTARGKAHASVTPPAGQGHTELECRGLREAGAFETIAEHFNTRAAGREDADSLAARVAAGPIEQAPPPTPALSELTRRLAAVGIAAELGHDGLHVRFAPPQGETLTLARPIPHPWLRQRRLEEVGVFEEGAEYRALVDANAKVERMIESRSPDALQRKAIDHLEVCARRFFDALVTPEHVRFTTQNTRVLFSGRAVASPSDLRIDQVGLPDEIAWTLFGPWVTRELGGDAEVRARSARATETLDRIMSDAWIIVHRAPTAMLTSFQAFHPVRCPDNVIRLHPMITRMMNADYDGDQLAVFLPITEAGQREAGERLSAAGHLRRDPQSIADLYPLQDALWGLASLSLTPEGREEIDALAGVEVSAPEGFVTRATFVEALHRLLERDGAERTLETIERLFWRGIEEIKASGASLSPFFGDGIEHPPAPEGSDAPDWDAYAEELHERLASCTDFADNDLGPQLLAVKTGARGAIRHLVVLIGSSTTLTDLGGGEVRIRRGFRDGLTPREMFAWTVRAREAIAQTALDMAQLGQNLRRAGVPTGFNLLARAMRAERPGVVFALAAASGECDSLSDVDGRLFAGLPATQR